MISTIRTSIWCIALSLCGVSSGLAQETAPADQQSVIMVLDGSGSMWGQVDGKAKIEVARSVIGDLLSDWDSSIQLGLVAYGHREKGACGDIETLVEVGPVNAEAVMAKVNAINPVGKTPISASVLQAAEALKYTEEKATVILVSDGLETCEADPCALATELDAKGVDFTAHVIGFDIAKEEQAGLACLAENTGGKYISAQNTNELTVAMAETVKAVKVPEPAPPASEPTPVTEAGPQGVKLSAKLCETCEDILDDDMYWRILEGKKNIEGKRKQLMSTGKASPFVDLAAGDYYVVARYGRAEPGFEFTVNSGQTTDLVVNLNAGNLRVDAIPTEGADDILDDKMYYQVFRAKTGLDGKRNQIDASGSKSPIFRLPAGDYIVQATHGKAVRENPVTVAAGELTESRINMEVGYAKISALMSEGGGLIDDDLYYRVFEAKQNLAGKRKQIDASGSNNPLFRLPAGDYVIHTSHGKAVTETPVTVSAGAMIEKTVIQNSGRIKAAAVLENGGSAVGSGVYWRVFDAKEKLDGDRNQIDASGGATPVFTLAAGDYLLAAKFGEKVTEQTFSITPGEEKAIELQVNP